MDYGMIGKLDKAKRYAQERDRFEVRSFHVIMHGANNDHEVTFEDGKWQCDCDFFKSRGRCRHFPERTYPVRFSHRQAFYRYVFISSLSDQYTSTNLG